MVEDKETLEYFLSLLDDAEHILSGDNLAEKKPFVDYEIKEQSEKKPSVADEPLSLDECRACPGWRERLKSIPAKIVPNSTVLCIIERPEKLSLLSPRGEGYFNAWFRALKIPMKDVSLSTLIKCPVATFSEQYATLCKDKLREEMALANPKALLLLGENVAQYMTRKKLPINELRGRVYKINHIPTVVSYSPEDLVRSYDALRAPIWEDLQLLGKCL